MQCNDLEEVEEFIKSRNLLKEEHVSFYTHWVLRYLRSGFHHSGLTPKDKEECSSNQLAQNPAIKDWQLRQPLQAVSLYLELYLKDPDHADRAAGTK